MKLLSSSPAAVQFGLLSSPLEEAQFSTIPLNITNHADVSLLWVERLIFNDVRCPVISYNDPPLECGIGDDVSDAGARIVCPVYPNRATNSIVQQQ